MIMVINWDDRSYGTVVVWYFDGDDFDLFVIFYNIFPHSVLQFVKQPMGGET